MGFLLLLAFIVVPIIEITVIGQVQEALGWPLTIAILILDSVIGAYLVRTQGARAWRRFQEALASAKMPTEEIVDGALILIGGALMLTPGFVTDGVGLAVVVPLTRRLINAALRRRITVQTGPMGTPFGGIFTMGRPPEGSGRRRPPGFVTGGTADEGRSAGRRSGEQQGESPPGEGGVIDVEVVEVVRDDES
ncbi:FxsA family protein [Euzebya tangerina]|uniref:FxsA family protein n=1 Tax=Euzebya tangerina TaxID=591198 RepID=UPI000E312213|nr:FxsA family protein [Euzebya tangerina]